MHVGAPLAGALFEHGDAYEQAVSPCHRAAARARPYERHRYTQDDGLELR